MLPMRGERKRKRREGYLDKSYYMGMDETGRNIQPLPPPPPPPPPKFIRRKHELDAEKILSQHGCMVRAKPL